jgi:hypothetical protein
VVFKGELSWWLREVGRAGFLHKTTADLCGGLNPERLRGEFRDILRKNKCQGPDHYFIAWRKIRKNYFMILYEYQKISITYLINLEYIDS